MAMSKDELVKREMFNALRSDKSGFEMRIFVQSSNEDQKMFSEGGLTFGLDGVAYGSCDCAFVRRETWADPFNKTMYDYTPIMAIEATAARSSGSSGNAQMQRFHHALGAVRNGALGVYYLRPGNLAIRPELFLMASKATELEAGTYLVTESLNSLAKILENTYGSRQWTEAVTKVVDDQKRKAESWFSSTYGTLAAFAKRRSTILTDEYVLKHAGRMSRNFTDSSQRAGHIAVGEMYLTKYLFAELERPMYYLFPRMTEADFSELDIKKAVDKEWHLLRNESGIKLISLDSLSGVPANLANGFRRLKDTPLKGAAIREYNSLIKQLEAMIVSNAVRLVL